MEMGSTEKKLEELSSFLKEEGSSLAAESDLSFVVNKEENVERYSYDEVARNKEFHVDLSDQGQQGSPSQHSDLRYNEISGSPSENFQSALQPGFDQDLLLNGTRVADGQQRLQSPLKNNHLKEEAEEVCAVDPLKSSPHVESENFHHEMENEVSTHLQEFPLTNQEEDMEDKPTSLTHDELGNGSFLEMSKYELAKSEFAYKELEHEVSDLQSEKLHSSPRVLHHNHEAKSENIYSKNSPAEKSSTGNELLSEGHRLGGDKQNIASRQESPRRSQHMNGSSMENVGPSPRNHDLSGKHRRRYSSASRSPVRQRDSSSRPKRDHHYRSRSRSPYRRDSYRRSPRRRYSPRHRSPPSGYHSYRRSPKRRPWSPPHNRSTGLGKPGRNLFVAGFSFLTTERDLERKFSRFGRVRDVRIVRDKRSGDSRGFGFLSLEKDEEADAAIRALDKTEWHGRIVLVEKSKSH